MPNRVSIVDINGVLFFEVDGGEGGSQSVTEAEIVEAKKLADADLKEYIRGRWITGGGGRGRGTRARASLATVPIGEIIRAILAYPEAGENDEDDDGYNPVMPVSTGFGGPRR